MITLIEAIKSRHSVRRYLNRSLSEEIKATLQNKINELNSQYNLNIQLICNEPKAFTGIFAYGKFSGVENYFVMAGVKDSSFDERVGYCGEQLVLLAQQLGLNTCWAGLSYRRIANTYILKPNEKIACYIALGYGETQGCDHKRKTFTEVCNINDNSPEWFVRGVEAALLAPTAINQQKFYFKLLPQVSGKPVVVAQRGLSLVGYTQLDLGIAKLHFEIAAGKENFQWD